jgi:hypothetical protein
MTKVRDHEPIVINQFNGLWDSGNVKEVPRDHFSDVQNLRFVGANGIATRYGIDRHQTVAVPLGNIVRIYNFITQDANTLLVLTYDAPTDTGKVYHVVNPTTVYGPILTKVGMSDIGFAPWAGRAFITPFSTYVVNGQNIEKGLQNEFLYVYAGDGTAARKAAGNNPGGTLTIANGAAGHTDAGFKVFGVVFETNSGYLTAPRAFATATTSPDLSVSFTNVPTGDSSITKRHIVSTININNFNGDMQGYTFFFIPNATINDNVTTSLLNQSFYDADLIDDASHLLDNYESIPAGVNLTIYRGRLVLTTTYTDISIALVSASGEPEAISQIDGLLEVPLDGNPITNAMEVRDILYLTKRNRTIAYVDNGDEPSNWKPDIIDYSMGAGVHSIATVIDSGSNSNDYAIVGTYRGITLFNGRYIDPELSWKISNLWLSQDRNNFRLVQMVNDSINKILYCTLTDKRLLVGDYGNGMDPKKIRWTIWTFDIEVNTIALVNTDDLIIGANQRLIV